VGARILFVTGKGGTGKSAVASALAREAARRGHPALLLRMPPSTGETAEPIPSVHRRGDLHESILDEKQDLESFLTRVLGLGFLARRLQDSRTFSAVAAAAPGLRDLVTLTSITARARARRGFVVVDAPATGHSIAMLTAPARVLELGSIGPVAREARLAEAALRNAKTFTVLLVTTPEELAVTEVLSLREQVMEAGVARPRIVINGLWPGYGNEADGERLAAASPDAAMHWRRHSRQAGLVAELETKVGPCARIAYSFRAEEGEAAALPAADIEALLGSLETDAA